MNGFFEITSVNGKGTPIGFFHTNKEIDEVSIFDLMVSYRHSYKIMTVNNKMFAVNHDGRTKFLGFYKPEDN